MSDMQNYADLEADVVVVGGTAAGCSAAIAAARSGMKVIVLEPTPTLGGVTTNGVHCFDTGSLQALSGIAEEFVDLVLRHYKQVGLVDPMLASRSDVFWEFHVAERIWRELLANHRNITVITGAVPVDVVVDRKRLGEVHWEPASDSFGNPPGEPTQPNRVRGKVFIDASYEGDVAAWAGAPFDIGREARSAEEPHAGVIYTATHERRVDDQGFLPSTILPGSTGAMDDNIMAFTYRLSLRYLKDGSPGRLQAKPSSYDPGKYAWNSAALSADGVPTFGPDVIPTVNGKMILNRRYEGNDLLQGTREFILSHPRERTAIRQNFFDHVLGFLHFIQTEGGMPQLVLAEDEYVENNHLPYILYVREGRRFRGQVKMTEANVNPYLAGPGPRPPRQPDSIAIGDWAIESRRCNDEPSSATKTYEGSMFMRALRAPYQVPYGCLTPQGVDNLLVTTTISASHVAFCALRVEALWTETGTAAGIAAGLSIGSGCKVSEVPVSDIQEEMLQRKCKLTYFSDVETGHPDFVAIQKLALKGFVPDDERYRFLPDMAATWGDLVEAAVLCFDIPISVTGFHFEGINPGHRSFRYVESLYDLASRAGVVLFPNMRHPVIDVPADHLRPELRTRWLELQVDAPVSAVQGEAFLDLLLQSLGHSSGHPSDSRPGSPGSAPAPAPMLTRGALASLLVGAARA
ncbi:hypothetical protein [Azospirillum endophyticum]